MRSGMDAQHAAEQMMSLEHGSPVTLKNLLNEGRIDALLEASVGAAHHNVVDQMTSMNLGIREKSAKTGGASDDGKVTITNGKETLRIPVARLPDAERDGFKRIQ